MHCSVTVNTVSVHQFYIGEWGGKGEQVGSMNKEPQVRGCYKAKSYHENTLFFFSSRYVTCMEHN